MPEKDIFNLGSVIKKGIDNRIKDLHTCLPGVIESFDSEAQTASVRPAIKRIFISRGDSEDTYREEELPLLINVPICFPRGGGFSMTFPIRKGDECLLVFSERSLDNWHISGEVSRPGSKRFHSLSDAVAIVGLSSVPKNVPDYDPNNTEIKKDDGSVSIRLMANSDLNVYSEADVKIEADGDLIAKVGGNIIAACSSAELTASNTVTVTSPETTVNGNVTVNGNITFTGVIAGPTGNIPAIISTSVAAASSVSVGGTEMSGHTHSAGSYIAGTTGVSGTSGGPV